MLTIPFPLLVALNEKGVSKSFPSVSPSSLPTHHAYAVRVLVFTSCFFSLYHPTHPPPRSLPTSPAENDSQSIFTLWSSPLSVVPPIFLSFQPLPLSCFQFSSSSSCVSFSQSFLNISPGHLNCVQQRHTCIINWWKGVWGFDRDLYWLKMTLSGILMICFSCSS